MNEIALGVHYLCFFDNDFHKINRVTRGGFLGRQVPAVCRSDLSPSVSRPLHCVSSFKQRRQLRQRQRHKASILLVKKENIIVLHVQHEFPRISLPYSTKKQREMIKF